MRPGRARPQPRRALHLRGAADRGPLRGRVLDRGGRREHARIQLVLPAADPHVHAARLARTGSRSPSSWSRPSSSASWPREPGAARPVGAPGRDRHVAAQAASMCGASWNGSPPRRLASFRLRARGSSSGTPGSSLTTATRSSRVHGGWASSTSTAPRREGRGAAAADPGARVAARGRGRPRAAGRRGARGRGARRTDAMKTALLRAVSHDLRSPLMAILTSASALAREDLELDRHDRAELSETISARPPGSTASSPTSLTCRGFRPEPPPRGRTSGPSTTSSGTPCTSSATTGPGSTSRSRTVTGGAGRLHQIDGRS